MIRSTVSISRSKIDKARILLKRVVNARRRTEGFCLPVTPEQWSTPAVERHLVQACAYLTEHCCEAEQEDLINNPHPDDNELDGALQLIGHALTATMVFSGSQSTPPVKKRTEELIDAAQSQATPREAQSVNLAAASEYLYWHLESDEVIRDFRREIPIFPTEKAMMDFLLSPLTQVLSLEDFQRLHLCPITTQGRVTVIEEREIATDTFSLAQREILRRKHGSNLEVVTEFAVEIDTPDGTTIFLTIERQGRAVSYSYLSRALEIDPTTQKIYAREFTEAGGYRIGHFFNFYEGSLGDPNCYPNFPCFYYLAYPGSICAEVESVCEMIRENDYITDGNAVMRFLLMGTRDPLFEIIERRPHSIFMMEWCTEMSTKTVLHIPNWILPQDLADFWQQVRPKKARERRLPSPESIRLFRFVVQKTPHGTDPQWAALARAWNQENEVDMTRDKLYKVYYSVLYALFPYHPTKESIIFLRERIKEEQMMARTYLSEQAGLTKSEN